jgi:enoyl-CoA hydratase
MAISTFSLVCRRAKLETSQLNALKSLRTRGICSVPLSRSSSLVSGQGYTSARAHRHGASWCLPKRTQLIQSYSTQNESRASIICSTKEHSTGHNVATISISNPAKLNIVNSPLLDELIATCQQLSQDDQLRAVLLTGSPTAAGKAASFIGGADIREMSQMSSYDGARTFITRVHNACAALRDIPVPVIARVDGFCLGAGLEIAASCDLRIATRSSTFGMPEVKIGLPSVVEAAYLPGLIGWGRTRRFLYLAENIDGVTAEKWGLVEKLVDDTEALDQATDEWTNMIVGMGPKCIRAQKRLMQHWERSNIDEAIRAGVDALAEAFRDGGKEPTELMEKFLSRRR